MSFWFKQGTNKLVVNDGGDLIRCDECPCGEEIICQFCPNMAKCWEFTVAGIQTALTCPYCPDLNGTWVVEWAGFPELCIFLSSPPEPFVCIGLTTFRYYLRRIVVPFDNTYYQVSAFQDAFNSSEIATWRIRASEFDCDGPNTLNFVSMNGQCVGAPSTITITPVTCPT